MDNKPDFHLTITDRVSLTGKMWADRLGDAERQLAAQMVQHAGLSDIVARVLAARSVELQNVQDYLHPSVKGLMPDPYSLLDMQKAAERLVKAIGSKEKIAIFGDYDVDGAASCAILAGFLRQAGLDPIIRIPDRLVDGYGPTPAIMDEFKAAGASLIVTVDCGVVSHQAVSYANDLGLEVIILDHHQAEEHLPNAVAVVDANRLDDLSGLGYLCAAGVVFLAVVATNRLLREKGFWATQNKAPDLLSELDLVALATVADVVPLIALNRAFVSKGVALMAQRRRAGLAALCDVAILHGPPAVRHLGFVLGPRINAGGRVGDASLGCQLLLEQDPFKARVIAEKLDQFNKERQAVEEMAVEEAMAIADKELTDAPETAVVIVESAEWHPGVAGLIASRLKGRFNKPTIAIIWRDESQGSGSARSIAGVDLGQAVRAAATQGLLIRGGGHAMAAGLTIERNQLSALKEFMRERLKERVDHANATERLEIDAVITARGVSNELAHDIALAGPYGAGNPEPIFVLANHTVKAVEAVGRGHLRLSLIAPDGVRLEAMAFRAEEEPLGIELKKCVGQALHIVGNIALDSFGGGAPRARFIVRDAAKP
jgi:single-stranded-DNA-specific exonuclease